MSDPIEPTTPGMPMVASIADEFRAKIAPRKSGKGPKFLGIDPKRLVEITETACRRIDDCRSEMGLEYNKPFASPSTWAWDRQVARIQYQGNMDYRRAFGTLGGTIFDQNNWSLNVCARIIRLLAAQHSGDLVGADPFCAVMPEDVEDEYEEKLSKQVEGKIQDELTKAKARMVLAESIRVALTEGERPIKVTWDEDVTQFIGDAVVMVNAPPDEAAPEGEGPGQPDAPLDPQDQTPISAKQADPVMTASGQYIFPKDEFLRFYVDAEGNSLGIVQTDPSDDPAAQQAATPPGAVGIQMRLKKEPSFILNQRPVYRLVKNLKQTITHKKGLGVAGLFCEDFIYPLKTPSLTDPSCDIIAHCYDEGLASIKARYRNAGYMDDFRAITASGAQSQQNQPLLQNGEYIYTDSRKMMNVHETYFRTRVNEDDEHESWLFLVIDYQMRAPVYAEYLGNMKMKRPPFILLRGVESEPGRAYGIGVYKKFADKNMAIDVWFNRAALKSSKTSSLTFQHEEAWKAEYQGQQLTIGGKEIYKIPANVAGEYGPDHPPVFRVNLNEMSDKEFELMEKLIQDGDLTFGVVNAADGASADLNASGTATGVRNIERTGNILQRATEELMAGDIEDLLSLVADTVLENLDEESVEYIPEENELATLNRDEIRNLPRDVRILLTKAKGEENLAVNQQASQIVETYYSKPMALRSKIYSFTVQQLKSLFVPDAEAAIEKPTDEQIQAEADAQQSKTEGETLTIALKDIGPLTPDERAQALALFSITASPPDQVAAVQPPMPPKVMPAPGSPPQAPPAPAQPPQAA